MGVHWNLRLFNDIGTFLTRITLIHTVALRPENFSFNKNWAEDVQSMLCIMHFTLAFVFVRTPHHWCSISMYLTDFIFHKQSLNAYYESVTCNHLCTALSVLCISMSLIYPSESEWQWSHVWSWNSPIQNPLMISHYIRTSAINFVPKPSIKLS